MNTLKTVLFASVIVGSIFLSGCKILVDQSGNYRIEIDKEEVTEPLIPVSSGACEVSNCHGLVTCGEPVEYCTLEYRLGDFCREYASCEQTRTGCAVAESATYTACLSCVQECEALPESQSALECETKCRGQMQK